MSSLPALPAGTYNRFDPTKGYKRHLFRTAKGLQSPELNEIQDALSNEARMFLDAEFGDGAMLKDGQVTPLSGTSQASSWLCNSGTFYAQGYLHSVPANTISVGKVGSTTFPSGETCTIGIVLHVDVVDELTDVTLLDPVPGSKNYGEPGAARMRYVATWGKQADAGTNDWFYHRLDFAAGQPVSPGNNTDATLKGIIELLSAYDRGANGDYIVSGSICSYLTDDTGAHTHLMQISQGTCNVSGYRQVLNYAYNLSLPMALDVQQVLAEPITFTANGTYTLRNTPVAAIGPQVNGIAQTTSNITHGAFLGAVDPLPHAPVVSISLITQSGTTYTQGVDYVQQGDRVAWINASRQPSPGSTYTVTYQYTTVFSPALTTDRKGIVVSGLAANTIFYVDYTYYIPRYDLIVIDQSGVISSIKGSPSPNPVPPSNTSGLVLATVYISFGNAPRITNSDQRRPLTSDLVRLQHSVDDLRYNIARLSLQDRLTSQDPVTIMKGLFVDPFTDDTYRDAGIFQTAEISAGLLFMAVPWLYVPLTDFTVKSPKVILGYSTTTLSQQLMHSREFQVNQFVGVAAPPADLRTWPTDFSWIDSTIVNVVQNSPHFVPYWAIGGVPPGIPWAGPPGDPRNQSGGANVVATTFSQSMVQAPVPVPVTTINYSATLFNANESVSVSFDNRLITTTTANSSGAISGSFQTPAGTLSGVKPITVVGQASGVVGTSSFSAIPLQDTITNYTVPTVYYDPLGETFGPSGNDCFVTDAVVYLSRDRGTPSPPPEGTPGPLPPPPGYPVNPYLPPTPASPTPLPPPPLPGPGGFVDLMLMETQVGLPDRTKVLTSTRLYDAQIGDANLDGTPTHFVFPQPVQLDGTRQYALVLASPNPGYVAWGCVLGDYDHTYGRWISSKPGLGTLLESSNSATWLPLLRDDLTYVVNKAVFQSSRTVTYPAVTLPPNVTDLMLLTSANVPSGTSVQFTITLTPSQAGGKVVTYSISPNAPISVPMFSGTAQVTAVLKTTDPNLTPEVDPNAVLAFATVTNQSTYITRSIPVPANASAAATTLKVYLEIGEADPNTVTVEYLTADGVTWQAFTRDVANAIQLGFGTNGAGGSTIAALDMPFLSSTTSMVGVSQTRLRITLSSADGTLMRRAYAKNLRATFS